MFILHGESLYGKVDQVPGLFHVATKFFHVNYLPLFPLGSYLVLEAGTSGDNFRGASIGWSGKSILFAWLRLVLMLAGAVTTFLTFIFLLELLAGTVTIWNFLGTVLTSAILWWLLYRSYSFTRAAPERALELAKLVGIGPQELAGFFVNDPRVSDSESAWSAEQEQPTAGNA
jgi:hypothetical protein